MTFGHILLHLRHDPFVRIAQIGEDVSDKPVRASTIEQFIRPPTSLIESDLEVTKPSLIKR